MTETLERGEMIALLERLGSDSDEEALAAARRVHARIADAGLSWDQVLVPDGPADAGDDAGDEASDEVGDEAGDEAGDNAEDEAGDDSSDEAGDDASDEAGDEAGDDDVADQSDAADESETEAAEDAPPAEPAGTDAEALALIGELLARSDISEELRAELEGYKADIAEGEFMDADRRYLRAVRKRLSK